MKAVQYKIAEKYIPYTDEGKNSEYVTANVYNNTKFQLLTKAEETYDTSRSYSELRSECDGLYTLDICDEYTGPHDNYSYIGLDMTDL